MAELDNSFGSTGLNQALTQELAQTGMKAEIPTKGMEAGGENNTQSSLENARQYFSEH